MSVHTTLVHWENTPHPVDETTYTRNHKVTGSEQVVHVSAAADFKGDPNCFDPEQMLVGSLASCHMLFFLSIAEMKGFVVESYRAEATGHLEKTENGRPGVARIELAPTVVFSGEKQPDAAALKRIHAAAHRNCFIANSLKAEVVILE